MKTLLKITLIVILFAALPVSAGEAAQQGRYQIVTNPSEGGMYTFLLDTVTGKIWRLTKIAPYEGEPSVWLAMDKIDGEKDFNEWANRHMLKTEARKLKE